LKYTINSIISVTYKEKRSKFIGFVKPIINVDEINNYLKKLKSKYPSSRHICWAYCISSEGEFIENSTDAGEPSGSAGLPILNVLKRNNITNTVIFVARFFGGVKLGKQGLINAYKTTAELAITESVPLKWQPKAQYHIISSVKYFGKIVNILQRNEGKIINDQTTDKLSLIIELPIEKYNSFKTEFDDITQNFGTIKKQSEHDQTKEVRK